MALSPCQESDDCRISAFTAPITTKASARGGRCQAIPEGPLHMTLRQRLATLAAGRLVVCAGLVAVPPTPRSAAAARATVVGGRQRPTPSRPAPPQRSLRWAPTGSRSGSSEASYAVGRPSRGRRRSASTQALGSCRSGRTRSPLLSRSHPGRRAVPPQLQQGRRRLRLLRPHRRTPGARPASTWPARAARQIRGAAARTRDTAQAGDLVYYPGHVMM